MPQVNDKVMSMVEQELRKNPDMGTPELFEKAKKLDASIAELSARQFNARYPLQVKRRNAPKRPRKQKPPARQGSTRAAVTDHEQVRNILLRFARDVAAAEGKADVVDVIGGVDRYVAEVVKAVGGR